MGISLFLGPLPRAEMLPQSCPALPSPPCLTRSSIVLSVRVSVLVLSALGVRPALCYHLHPWDFLSLVHCSDTEAQCEVMQEIVDQVLEVRKNPVP